MRRDVQEIFRNTPHGKQVMMFSATLSKDIRPVCKKFMQDVIPTLLLLLLSQIVKPPTIAPSAIRLSMPSVSASIQLAPLGSSFHRGREVWTAVFFCFVNDIAKPLWKL